MSDENAIKEGDVVDVEFEYAMAIYNATVLYVPCATGDSWRLRDSQGVIYVQNFCTMRRVNR